MLQLIKLSLINALLFAPFLLRRNYCDGFPIHIIQQYTTNTCVPSKNQIDTLQSNNIRCRTSLHTIKSESLMVNGSKGKSSILFFEGMDVAALPEGGELTMTVEAESPPMSFDKFVTMQEKRAVVTIRYSGDAGLKPYFLTIAKKLKQSHPDIVIERRILPSAVDGNYEATFEVLVEGKVVIGKSRHRKVSRNGNNDVHDIIGRRSVYVSMNELDLAISRARRKHRPSTVYGGGTGDNETAVMISNSKQRNSKVSTTTTTTNSNSSSTGIKNIDSTSGRTDWSD
jgi:hypothetical protein